MDRNETIQVLTVLKAAYPHSFKDLSARDANAMIDIWQTMFAAESYAEVNAAVGALISTRKEGFTPTIGEVKERLAFAREQASGTLSEQAAWAMVEKACRNGLYGYKKEFEKLPPEVQRVVGEPEQLKAWAEMDAETVNSVVASNFMRSYRVEKQREKERSLLPPSVLETISLVSGNMKMIGE